VNDACDGIADVLGTVWNASYGIVLGDFNEFEPDGALVRDFVYSYLVGI
jgi:hypothetical protein